ncbi:MAG: hypothetical protein JRF30_07530 [Deltaproteobacteria bacterium]|nr:hypothetical protein [Deltaproteobacteria bacterium]MBW1794381.1 hypothetical protein [Deltaproteobacteria bacterium]MBW2330764.1 hypothetical protein [Deltaproteobacteria bacterium]
MFLRSLPAIATDLAGIVHTKHRDLPAIAMCGGIVATRRAWRWQAGGRRVCALVNCYKGNPYTIVYTVSEPR